MFNPLTDEERAALNSVDTSRSERERLYALDLYFTAQSYAQAADAPGLPERAAKYLYAESTRLHREAGLHSDLAYSLLREEALAAQPRHTVRGQTSDTGWPYGTTHDMDCPGCAGSSFTSSPRSETYWSS